MNHDELVKEFTALQAKFADLVSKKGEPVKVVYAPKKLTEFKGGADENIDYWITKARDALKVQGLKDQAAAEFICAHLGEAATVELKYATPDERNDPEQLFQLLKDAFEDSRSAIEILDVFNARQQREKESLTAYSQALMRLLDRALTRDPQCLPDRERALKTRFAENIRDQNLRRDVKKTNREHPTWTFRKLRAEAILLADDCTNSKKVRQNVQEVNMDMPETDFCEQFTTCSSQASAVKNEVHELRQQFGQLLVLHEKQQEQIGKQSKALAEMQKKLTDKQDSTEAKGSSNQVKGPCYFCKKMGHVKRECWKLKGQSRNGQGDQFGGKNFEGQPQGYRYPVPVYLPNPYMPPTVSNPQTGVPAGTTATNGVWNRAPYVPEATAEQGQQTNYPHT